MSRIFSLLFLFTTLAVAGDDPQSPFSSSNEEPVLVGRGTISTGDSDLHATLSPDGGTLYFLKGTPSFDFWAIAETKWQGGRWTAPRILPFSGRHADADLAFAPDGRHAYFVSRRPVDGKPRDDTEIWRVEYDNGNWGAPEHVTELSSPGDEWFPTFDENGMLYFGSSRPGGRGGHDIWKSRLVNGVFESPVNLGAPINSEGEEIEAFITPDGTRMVVAAKDRGDGIGGYDLYVSQRCEPGWAEPARVEEPINSYAWEFGPRLSPDGHHFFFTSNRGFGPEEKARKLSFQALEQRVREPNNGLHDVHVIQADVLWRHLPSCAE